MFSDENPPKKIFGRAGMPCLSASELSSAKYSPKLLSDRLPRMFKINLVVPAMQTTFGYMIGELILLIKESNTTLSTFYAVSGIKDPFYKFLYSAKFLRSPTEITALCFRATRMPRQLIP